MLLAVLLVLLVLSLAAGIPVALGAIDILIKKYNTWLRNSRYRDVLLPCLAEPRKLLYLQRSGRTAAFSALGWALMALGELVRAPWLYRVGVGYLVVCICVGVYYVVTGKAPGPARFRRRAGEALAPVKTRISGTLAPVKARIAALCRPVAARIGAILRPVGARIGAVLRPAAARVGGVLKPVFQRAGAGCKRLGAWIQGVLRPVTEGVRKAWRTVCGRVRPVREGFQAWTAARRENAGAILRKGVAYGNRFFHFGRKAGSQSAAGNQLPDAGGCGGVLPAAPAAEGIHRPGEGQGEPGSVHPGGADAP
jgi:hypothetical protein